MNIFDYFTSQLGQSPNDDTLRNLPVDSECGRTCKRSIDAAAVLLSVSDPHPEVRGPIIEGTEMTVSIFWNG